MEPQLLKRDVKNVEYRELMLVPKLCVKIVMQIISFNLLAC